MFGALYSAVFHHYPPAAFFICFSSFSFVTPPISSSLPVDPAQGQVITISKPFARSLPANPVFGLMSHAPHLPRCRPAWDPFTNTSQGPLACPGGPQYCWSWGGGLWAVPLGLVRMTRSSRVEIRVLNVNLDKIFNYYLHLCLPEITVSTMTKYNPH